MKRWHDENLSYFRETIPNHGFYGAEEEQNDGKREERKKEKRETGEGKKDIATFCFYNGNFKQQKQKPFAKTTGTSEFVTPNEL